MVRRAKTILGDLETEHGVSYAPSVNTADQVSFTAVAEAEAVDLIRRTQVDTLTPLEAMTLLYELKQKLN